MGEPGYRLVLASASPARLKTLRRAGLAPEVVVPEVDESAVDELDPTRLARALAVAKCREVSLRLTVTEPTLVVGCDSVLDLDGVAYGKPGLAGEARRRWQAMRGRSGTLLTGHCIRRLGPGEAQEQTAVAATTVHFATLSDREIEAYVATGEPLAVAGAFTIDGLGGAFVTGVEGDPHNVVGISLPLLRTLLAALGVSWTDLWAR